MKNAPWRQYKVGEPSKTRWVKKDRKHFDTVRHTAHIRDAIRIIEDGVIRSSLVWDESCLNNTRTCVSWVSPNTWGDGSIYGNVSFEFSWDTLVKDKRLYWVEDMPGYTPPAYRILVTANDYDSSKLIVPYHPNKGDGPLYFDGKQWYRNGRYTGELMIDSDLPLDDCEEINFVKHHNNICAKSGRNCRSIGLSLFDAGAMVLANLIGRNISEASQYFLKQSEDDIELTPSATSALSRLRSILGTDLSPRSLALTDEDSILILRAALVAYGDGNEENAYQLVDLLGTKEKFLESFQRILEEYFDIEIENIKRL